MDEVSTAVKDEIEGKAKLIGEEMFRELEPVILTALEMYETNEYHVRDITNAVVKAMEKIRYCPLCLLFKVVVDTFRLFLHHFNCKHI